MDELTARWELADRDRTIEVLHRLIENMETQHITWQDAEDNVRHPDWCRECRVSVLLALLWKVMIVKSGDLSRRADDRTATD